MWASRLHRPRREAIAHRVVKLRLALPLLLVSGPALADDPPIPRRPAPFVLPDLTHAQSDVGLDWTAGRLSSDRRPSVAGGVFRATLETSGILPQKLYVGSTLVVGSALPPDGGLAPGEAAPPSGARTLVGNVESWVRAVFTIPSAIELGFLLGVVAPTATFDRTYRPNRSVAEALSSFDPTSYVHFLQDRVALRPAGDLRFVRGPLSVQLRHGFDIIIDDAGIDSAKLAGRILGHVGVMPVKSLELGLEFSQVYFFSSDDRVAGPASPENAFAETYRISDDHRASLTLGPTVRYATRDFDVGLALVTNTREPLSPVTDEFVALRFSVITHLGWLRRSKN